MEWRNFASKIDLFIRCVEYQVDNRNANGVVDARLKDNAGRRGNKREKIKRVPFKFEGSLS